jgi:hypothetical protein
MRVIGSPSSHKEHRRGHDQQPEQTQPARQRLAIGGFVARGVKCWLSRGSAASEIATLIRPSGICCSVVALAIQAMLASPAAGQPPVQPDLEEADHQAGGDGQSRGARCGAAPGGASRTGARGARRRARHRRHQRHLRQAAGEQTDRQAEDADARGEQRRGDDDAQVEDGGGQRGALKRCSA